jgi:hypothetical protein
LLYTPLAIISLPVYFIYLAVQVHKEKKKPKNKQWVPESPYEVLPPPNKNSHYGVDL